MKKYGSYRTDKILKFEISDRVKFMQKAYGRVSILSQLLSKFNCKKFHV